MFCSNCGFALAPGQPACPQCGQAVVAVPGFQFQLDSYADKVRVLSLVWVAYAAISLLMGLAGLSFARGIFMHHFGDWNNGPWGDGGDWFFPSILHLIWVTITLRAALALVAAWGLYERTQWGRVVAIIAAILSLIKFPFGTALGIWTLVTLLGYQNATLYQHLSMTPRRIS